MESLSPFTLAVAALWLCLCVTAGVLLVRRYGRQLPFPDQRFMLVALVLLAIAPVSYVLSPVLSGRPALFPSGLQIAAALLFFAASVRARKVREVGADSINTRPFAEKSAWLVLLGLVVVFAMYFARIVSAPVQQSLGAFVGAISLLIVLMIVGHIVIALFHAPIDDLDEPEDERDRAISLRAIRNSYYMLAAGFWTMPVVIIAPLPMLTALNVWLAILVLAEIVHYGSVVYLYRYGTA